MSKQTFTTEQIRLAFKEWCGCSAHNFLTELTKPKWNPPNVGQVYFNELDLRYFKNKTRVNLSKSHPLTTKEAGPECMQHLIDALEDISSGLERSWWKDNALETLTKHKRLME